MIEEDVFENMLLGRVGLTLINVSWTEEHVNLFFSDGSHFQWRRSLAATAERGPSCT